MKEKARNEMSAGRIFTPGTTRNSRNTPTIGDKTQQRASGGFAVANGNLGDGTGRRLFLHSKPAQAIALARYHSAAGGRRHTSRVGDLGPVRPAPRFSRVEASAALWRLHCCALPVLC
jgi:hypothetical protein